MTVLLVFCVSNICIAMPYSLHYTAYIILCHVFYNCPMSYDLYYIIDIRFCHLQKTDNIIEFPTDTHMYKLHNSPK